MKAHKDNTATFAELTYAEQANSINAQLLDLEASIKANISKANDERRDNPLVKRIQNLKDMIKRLEELL